MGWSNHKLTYPFTKLKSGGRGDLENALNYTATSMAALFANGTIVKWAKYKGFQYSGAIADRYSAAGTSTRDLALKERNYGLGNIPIWETTMNRMVNFWLNINKSGNAPTCGNLGDLSNYWTYVRPTTYLRALDFENYIDNAQAPISPLDSSCISVTASKDVNVTYPSGARNSDTIKFDDLTYSLTSGANMYFGMMFYNPNGGSRKFVYKTDSQKISTSWAPGVSSVASGGTNRLFGTWQVFPFLSTVAQSSWVESSTAPTTQGVFVALLPPQEISISAPSYDVRMTAYSASLRSRTRYVDWSFTVQSYASIALSASAVITFYNSSRGVIASDTVSFTIAANTSTSQSGSHSFPATQVSQLSEYDIVVTFYGQSIGTGYQSIGGILGSL